MALFYNWYIHFASLLLSAAEIYADNKQYVDKQLCGCLFVTKNFRNAIFYYVSKRLNVEQWKFCKYNDLLALFLLNSLKKTLILICPTLINTIEIQRWQQNNNGTLPIDTCEWNDLSGWVSFEFVQWNALQKNTIFRSD